MNLPGQEIRVGSWQDLISALHGFPIIQCKAAEGGHRRSPYVFRGLDVADWGLETSLQRLPGVTPENIEPLEKSLIRSFRKYASAGLFDDKSAWYVLAVAQHNGLPTRCLDWTTSPLVATHFACADERCKDRDGVVWCLHGELLRDINRGNSAKVASLKETSWVFDTRQLEESFSGLDELDRIQAGGGDNSELMLLWEPPSLDARIEIQSGLFTIMNGRSASHLAFLRKYSERFPELVSRVVVAASAKREIRDMLDQNNISERMLFPGLPGLCNWLKRYYGVAW